LTNVELWTASSSACGPAARGITCQKSSAMT
jgi:hypothetical protein